jgi:hypothetical protein
MLPPLPHPHRLAATGNHPLDPNAMRSTSQRQIELETSKSNARTANGQSRCSREVQDEKTAMRLGSSRYRETAATTSRTIGLT